jgi:hypothetical protein
MSSLNWSDLVKEAGETSSFEPLPDGDYALKVIEATAKVSQSGKTMFAVTTEVQGGPHAKRRIWDNLVVSPDSAAALGIFFKKMEALGLPKTYFDQNPTNAQIEAALRDRSFRGRVGSRTWQGKKSNEIKDYFPAVVDGVAPAATAATPFAAPAPAPAPAPAVAPVYASAPAPAPAAPVSSADAPF